MGRYMGLEGDSELLSRIKRLLDLDRKLPLPRRALIPRAFFSERGPGRGYDVLYSEYECFAVLLGLKMLEHGWPQQDAVELLRDVRGNLAALHSEIMREDPDELFNARNIEAYLDKYPYATSADNAQPSFLVILSHTGKHDAPKNRRMAFVSRNIADATARVRERPGNLATFIEVVTPAFKLRDALKATEPTKRGRS